MTKTEPSDSTSRPINDDRDQDLCKFCKDSNHSAKTQWIECDGCKEWIHCGCVNMNQSQARAIHIYYCIDCEPEFGKSSLRRVSTRQRQAIDYNLLNEGESLVSREKHIHLDQLKAYPFAEDTLPRVTGEHLTSKWANATGLLEPVVIPAKWYPSLEMTYPAELTVRKVSDIIGGEFAINVMDVPTQRESKGWTLNDWTEYYETPAHLRERVRNVISLEFSQTDLAKLVQRPKFVREMDWVNQVWPPETLDEHPQVSLYCLMSVQDSFTDFHVDFGGSSVFYHVIKGQKVFYFISPSSKNLKVYETWCLSTTQSSQFFPELVDSGCIQVTLNEGDSMIIPSGWIHAVHTPSDSLVIGGNFLTPINIPTQLKLTKIEQKTKVPQKFRFPYFSKVLWFAVLKYLRSLDDKSPLVINGLEPMLTFLYEDAKLLAAAEDAKEVKRIRSTLPAELKKSNDLPLRRLKQLAIKVGELLDKEPLAWAMNESDQSVKRRKIKKN